MLKLKYAEQGLKEVQIFIGVSIDLVDNDTLGKVVHLDMVRVIGAGLGNSLYLTEDEALCFSFHNRHLLVAIPENQRENFYNEVIQKLYISEARQVVFTLNTRYRNFYSNEIISTSTEKFSVERELVHVIAMDVSESRYYSPMKADGVINEIFTVHDCVSNNQEPHVDKTQIRASNLLAYFNDAPNCFYRCGNGIAKHYWCIYHALHIDPSIGHVVYGGHMPHDPQLHDFEYRKVKVKLTTKDGLHSATLVFIDPRNVIESFFKTPHLVIRFRDAMLYGIDLSISDYDIEVYPNE